ncbi:helix-turn-helix domain-containing protein [Microbacterium sp. CFBP 8794]|uniref:helix-turn-helix domain-containing protein n=1 Tax=Microbacterium sp. CFBP 8794 TaxID=2775269 RepID=UPI00177B01E2|nr:helix-turn-helix domain-containing protein [Microbacterium sp. CFBP 8794]MBD8477589.1 helix-turn-helix domain-containing protein [Microbacterium sp. CFBP 8794]
MSRHLTDADRARIEALRAEGMPATWIAEDLGVHPNTIRLAVAANPAQAAAWRADFQHIRRNAELFALHCEIAPAKRGNR